MKAVIVLLSVVLLFVACKRRTPAVPPAPSAPATPPTSESVAKPAPPPAAAPGGSSRIQAGDQNLPALNTALKAYMTKHKKAPAKLDDLAKDGFITFVPFAPPGMRYELDAVRGEVKLINPMVK